MSANTQQIRKITSPRAESNQFNPILLLLGLPLDALLLVARHLDYEAFENMALTCQHANQQFRVLLTNERFNQTVLPAPRFFMNELRKATVKIPVKAPREFRPVKGFAKDSIMSHDGKWLFVLCVARNSHRHWVDLFKQQSASPLEYQHVRRHHFQTSADLANWTNFYFVGQDQSDENPGVYLSGAEFDKSNVITLNTRQIYSWHLSDNASECLTTVGERLPFHDIAVERRTNDLQVYGISGQNCLKRITLTHQGQAKIDDEELTIALKPGNYKLILSPNNKSVAVLETLSKILKVLSKNLKLVTTVSLDLSNQHQYRFSISDDGGTLFHEGIAIPLDGALRTRPSSLPDSHIISHTGSCSLSLYIPFYIAEGYAVKCFLAQKKLSASETSTLRTLVLWYKDHDYDDYRQTLHALVQELLLRFRNHAIIPLRNSINLRDPQTLFAIFYEIFPIFRDYHLITMEMTERFLLCFADAITLMKILELARDPNLHKLPRTGLVELASSPHGQALSDVLWGTQDSRDALDAWFNDPSRIETKEIGRISFAFFLWGPPTAANRNTVEVLSSQYEKRPRGHSEKVILFEEIQRTGIQCSNPLLFCARETSDHMNYIEVCCRSRYSKLDNKRKQLIPSGVVRAISQAPDLKNVLLLNALLKKIIELTFNPKQKAAFKATRIAMLKAVESNPSLREDMAQLLTTHFYGNDSVEECLQGSPYYQEVMTHLRSKTPDVEEALNARHGQSSGV